ncbi:hypothetical protein CMK13_05545 [Candidatus Poribacteria bacterium]|nr:hypothetical protein [Candidatus Poribacteria bacterium]
MLKNFEEITKELTDNERDVLYPLIVSGLSRRKGKQNSISGSEICEALNKRLNAKKITPPRLRKIIQAIRINGDLYNICSNSKGYYLACSKQEIDDNILSLQQRIDQQQKIVDALRWQSNQTQF